jgi:two-component system OmpR family sensor kinase
MTGPLRTVSLRRRVTLSVMAVLGVVLVGLVLLVNTLFATATTKSLNGVLAERLQFAQQLAQQHASPEDLVDRVSVRGVRARLVLADGTAFGRLPARAADEQDPTTRQAELRVPGRLNGARLSLALSTAQLSGAKHTLLQVLLFTGIGALVLTAMLLVLTVRRALAPLDSMTAVARSIAGGDRGARLSPQRTDTELGRTAEAFDEMLEALEGAETQARDAQARTERFVADAAHELRTPIAGVQAAAEAVLQQAPDADPEERNRLQMLLVRESRRAGQLVEDLLQLANLDTGITLRREPCALNGLVAAQAERAEFLTPGLVVDAPGGADVVVPGDPDRITQILANLVDNACQAMRRTQPSPDAPGRLSLYVNDFGTHAEVIVGDTGPGVPAADRERVFDRLVRLDEARARRTGGSGLGLAIARGLARAHGGDLTCVEPASGTGAVFRLVLPR